MNSPIHTRTFKSGNSEAVRLPREFAYGPGTELVMIRNGMVTTLYPKPKQSLADMVRRLREIGPPEAEPQKRDAIDFPERPGL